MNGLSRPIFNLLVLFGYSALFTLLGGRVLGDAVGVHWSFILFHAAALFIAGCLGWRNTEGRPRSKNYFLSMLLVLLIGHGLCFFNGLLNFNMH